MEGKSRKTCVLNLDLDTKENIVTTESLKSHTSHLVGSGMKLKLPIRLKKSTNFILSAIECTCWWLRAESTLRNGLQPKGGASPKLKLLPKGNPHANMCLCCGTKACPPGLSSRGCRRADPAPLFPMRSVVIGAVQVFLYSQLPSQLLRDENALFSEIISWEILISDLTCPWGPSRTNTNPF